MYALLLTHHSEPKTCSLVILLLYDPVEQVDYNEQDLIISANRAVGKFMNSGVRMRIIITEDVVVSATRSFIDFSDAKFVWVLDMQ